MPGEVTFKSLIDVHARAMRRRIVESPLVDDGVAYVMDDPDHDGRKLTVVSTRVFLQLQERGLLTDDGYFREAPIREWHPPMALGDE